MPGKGSPGRVSRRRHPAGFTLFEMLVVMVVIGLVAELAGVVLMAARRQTSGVCLTADSQAELIRVRRCLLADIRQARSASGDGQGWAFVGPGASRVVWSVANGRLRRTAGGHVRNFRLACQGLRADSHLDEGAGTDYIEVRLVMDKGRNVLVAAARTRVGKAAP